MGKNKLLIPGIIVLILVIGGGAYHFLSSSSKPQTAQSTPSVTEEVVPTINPTDLGLTFTARKDNKAVKFEIANVSGIASVDYEISYTASGNVPRGVLGHLDVKPTDKTLQTDYLDLGTCSSGVCKYDTGVTSVDLILKITKTDGNTYSSQTSLSLE